MFGHIKKSGDIFIPGVADILIGLFLQGSRAKKIKIKCSSETMLIKNRRGKMRKPSKGLLKPEFRIIFEIARFAHSVGGVVV